MYPLYRKGVPWVTKLYPFSLQVKHMEGIKTISEFKNSLPCLQISNNSILIYPNSLEDLCQHVLLVIGKR